MHVKTAFVLILLSLFAGWGLSQAQAPGHITGSWKVEITFHDGGSRSLRFEAGAAGKGSFAPVVPRPNQTESAQPATAEWSEDGKGSVTFTGPVQFPLGNVGLERGTLVLKGRRRSDGSITGAAQFFPADQDPGRTKPSKTGTFRTTKVAA